MKPQYTWRAEFNNGTIINQFDGEKENLFGLVEKDKDKLITFRIEKKDNEYYEVDLTKGTFDYNGEKTIIFDIPANEKADLIYFRRNQERRDFSGKILEKKISNHIGLKYKDNKKIIIKS